MPVRKREIFGWCCFDFANSAFTTVVITVVGLPYFTAAVAGNDPRAAGWWGTTLSVSQLLVLLLSPLIGVLADLRATKKRYLLGTALLCSLATAALTFAGAGEVALMLGLLLVANLAFALSENVCAAFLPELSTPATAGRISGYGWAFGYLGGLVSLGLALAVVMSGEGRAQWTFLITGGFFFVMSLPTLLLLRERAVPQPLRAGETLWGRAFAQFGRMRRELPRHRRLARFLIAFTVFMAGLMAVVGFAAGYATSVVGMTQNNIIVLFAVLQLAGTAGAFLFGYIQDKIGPKLPLVSALLIWIVACAWASVCRSVTEFYAIGVLAGVGMGSLQSASRAVVSTLTPDGRQGEFFGYWGVFGKLAGMIGFFVFGHLVGAVGYRTAIALNAGFFALGLLLVLPLTLRPEKNGVTEK